VSAATAASPAASPRDLLVARLFPGTDWDGVMRTELRVVAEAAGAELVQVLAAPPAVDLWARDEESRRIAYRWTAPSIRSSQGGTRTRDTAVSLHHGWSGCLRIRPRAPGAWEGAKEEALGDVARLLGWAAPRGALERALRAGATDPGLGRIWPVAAYVHTDESEKGSWR
jgi:hypothetical protein